MSRPDVDRMGTPTLLASALRLLWRASPGALAATVLTAVLQGVAPNIVTLAGARLVALAPDLTVSGTARTAAGEALAVLTAALVVERVAAALAPVTSAYLGFRFTTALERLRMASCARLPGLEHFDSATFADRLETAGWSRSAPPLLLEKIVTLVRRGAMLVGSLLILTTLGWWAPLVVSLAAIGIGVNDWRHASRRADMQRAGTPRLRYAAYQRELAVDPRHAREVRLFGLGDWLATRQHRFWSEAMAGVFADLRRQLAENAAINLLRAATLVVPLVVALVQLSSGTIGAADFTAVILALRTASNGMYVLEGVPGGLRQTIAFLPEVLTMARLPDRDPRLATAGRTVPPRRSRDGIRFEGVVFRYPGVSTPILTGLDLHLPAGGSLALVGANGAGKSTIVKLLCRFYDPTAGRITLDGVDLREFDLPLLRQRMAVIFQEFVRLPMSGTDNLDVARVGTGATAEVVTRAAARAGVAPVLDALPAGWDTPLSREFGGVELSGGQWQRLALARLLAAKDAHDAPILVLDEPTAALDVQIEAELYERFEELTRDATTMLISHRLSTVRMAHRVALLEHGRIAELGSHEELIRADGRYAALFRLQARRFQWGDLR